MTRVREVIVPPEAIARAGLDPISYREGFAFTGAVARTPEQWARLAREGASGRERLPMLGTWVALGVGLAPLGSPRQVLGWRIRHNDETR